ncbi:MAG: DUF4276 family protein [Pirellulales bacterium]
MKFILLVEGDTEKKVVADFLKRWLDHRLNQRVRIDIVRFRGNDRLMREMVAKAQTYLDGPGSGEIVAVIGLLDLYGLDCYPREKVTARDRYDWAVEEFHSRVDRTKFRMFFAVHELEAWILAQPECLPRAVLDALPRTVAEPERVDFDEPPAKLLSQLYRKHTRREYKKVTYGQQLFRKLDPDVVVGKCPYLKAMLAEMLKMAKAAEL